MEQLNGYIAINGAGKKIEIYAESLYQAKVKAIAEFKPRGAKQERMISVYLAEKAGEPVVHDGSEL